MAQSVQEIIQSLGYVDPLDAARQQARMILLGRLARYQAEIQHLQHKWDKTLDEMRLEYQQPQHENFEADDDYISWQWYQDAVAKVQEQLNTLTAV